MIDDTLQFMNTFEWHIFLGKGWQRYRIANWEILVLSTSMVEEWSILVQTWL